MRKTLIITAIVLFGSALFLLGFLQTNPSSKFPNITVNQLKAKLDLNADLVILDVRTNQEWDGPLGHIKNARLIPLQELSKRYTELNPVKNKEIIVYCRSGNRSQVATTLLRENGFNAVNMIGGMKAWNAMTQADTLQVNK